MSRINTNVPSLIAQNNLKRSGFDLSMRLQRLSTGLRINRGADDPAGLIVSERLRSEIKGLDQAVENSERASSVIATSEGYLAEVADLLNSLKSLVVKSANSGGVSPEEIEANQLEIDSAIESITRISNTASFAGLQLLNGSLSYITSGVSSTAIEEVDLQSVQFGNASNVAVSVEVVQSAQLASLFLSGNRPGATGVLESAVTLEIAGPLGVQTLTFDSGTQLSAVVAGVNVLKDTTGVSASLVDPSDQSSGLTFNSRTFGSESFVSVKKIGQGGNFFQTYDAQGGNSIQRDTGRDVRAIINGAVATGDGLQISLNTPALSMSLDLTSTFATTVNGTPSTFTVTGGGALFQLGPSVSATQQTGVGVKSIAASRLGGTTVAGVRYYLDSLKSGNSNSVVSGQFTNASDILDNAITELSVMRGRLGAFERNTVQTNIRALQIGRENITASESKIRDADFAAETAALTRAQILQQAGTSVLAAANSNSQNVLALLQ
ncbi:MAG: flagellin [Phycisphaerae bacterium]|nr:flagellin [Phycisphaerae bacterium]